MMAERLVCIIQELFAYQKTGASLKNILASSAVTHLTTVLAAATTADLGSPGTTLIYSSKGLVICQSALVHGCDIPRRDRLRGLSSCRLISGTLLGLIEHESSHGVVDML